MADTNSEKTRSLTFPCEPSRALKEKNYFPRELSAASDV